MIYSTVTTVNSIVLYTWKLLRENILNVLITNLKKNKNKNLSEVILTYCGDHLTIYTCIITLYTLNFHNVVCQLYPKKDGGK